MQATYLVFVNMKKIPLSFTVIIVLIWSLPAMSTDIYLPSVPAMAKYFHESIAEVQYSFFYYTAGFSTGALFFGPISDRIGRRKVILGSLIFAAISTICAGISINLSQLFIARFCQGIAMVGIGSTIRAVLKDVCEDRESMAKFGAILGIAIPVVSALAPIIGGYIEEYLNWRASFGFLLICIIAFIIYGFAKLPETNNNRLSKPIKSVLKEYKEILFNSVFFRYNALTAFALCSMYAYLTVSPYLLQVKLGLTPTQFGYTNLVITLTLIISSYINTKLIYHRGVDSMLLIGAYLLGIAGVIFAINELANIRSIIIVLLPVAIMACGCGFIFPNASAGGLSLFAKGAGTAAAIYACIQMLGGSIGSGIISYLDKYLTTQASLALIMISLGIIGIIFSKQLINKNKTFI